jgi:hypothetical protein
MDIKKHPAFSKAKLLQGFRTIDKLWERGLLPKDLERHYFLHWFVVYGGNIIRTAEAIKIHRNTIQNHFLTLGFSSKAVRLRHSWQALASKNKTASFDANFFKFYQKFGRGPKFTAKENQALTGLWQTRFPYKTLKTYYLLWALRTRKPREWAQKKLDFSYRHRTRLLTSLLKTKTRDGFWLAPLKPTFKEIYSSRYRNILSEIKKR